MSAARPRPSIVFELFADGLRLGRCNAGEGLELDTTKLPDGFCELRIAAIEDPGRSKPKEN